MDGLAVGHGDELDGGFGKFLRLAGPAKDQAQGRVGVDGLGAAPEDDGVSGLKAQGGGIDRHIGARFVDDPDDAEGNPHPADEKPVGAPPHGGDLPDGIGKGGNLLEPPRHGADRFLVQREPVDHGLREAFSPRVLDVLLVFLDEGVRVMDELLGHLDQGLVLLRTR